jgi:hypothetical protein
MSAVAVAALALSAAAQGEAAAAPSTAHARTSASSKASVSPLGAPGAAAYLVRNLAGKHHDHFVDVSGKHRFPDDGETADAVLSLDAAGVAQKAARRATSWLEKDATSYAGAAPDVYPGSAGKLLLVADAQHVDPSHFRGLDLVAALDADEGAGGAAAGEFQNPGDLDFGSSVLDQALAVLALAGATGADGQPDATAVSFLAGQQCSAGGFQIDIRSDATSPCSEDVDTTAYAVQALLAAGMKAPATKAIGWLRSVENKDGGWGETPGAKSDGNSTAIAIEALLAAHDGDNAAARWLAGRQLGCGATKARRGAVPFEHSYERTGAVRATSQAGVALADRSLTQVDKDGASAPTPALSCPKHHGKSKKK